MVSIDSTGAPAQAAVHASTNKLYLAAWRWHFYAGLYVIPFFAVLAITGMAMAWIAYIDGRDGERIGGHAASDRASRSRSRPMPHWPPFPAARSGNMSPPAPQISPPSSASISTARRP
jgi:hypothetical protein